MFENLEKAKGDLEAAKATWTTAYVNDLPDSAFLYVEPGGEKDEDGKTTPRSLRHFPYKDADGNVDLPHLRNAIARIPQSNIPDDEKEPLQERARNILDRQDAAKGASIKLSRVSLDADGQVVKHGAIEVGGCATASVVVKGRGEAQTSYWFVRGSFENPTLQLALGYGDTRKALRDAAFDDGLGEVVASVPLSLEQSLAMLGQGGDACGAVRSFLTVYEKARTAREYVPKVLDPGTTHECRVVGVAKSLTEMAKVEADANGELRLVTGIVLEPDVTDAQKDTYSAEEIRKTAHMWMLDFQNVGLQHKATINHQVSPVETWIAPSDMEFEMPDGETITVKAGTWMLTVKVFDDGIWEAVKKGDLTGFSIEGFARRTPVQSAT